MSKTKNIIKGEIQEAYLKQVFYQMFYITTSGKERVYGVYVLKEDYVGESVSIFGLSPGEGYPRNTVIGVVFCEFHLKDKASIGNINVEKLIKACEEQGWTVPDTIRKELIGEGKTECGSAAMDEYVYKFFKKYDPLILEDVDNVLVRKYDPLLDKILSKDPSLVPPPGESFSEGYRSCNTRKEVFDFFFSRYNLNEGVVWDIPNMTSTFEGVRLYFTKFPKNSVVYHVRLGNRLARIKPSDIQHISYPNTGRIYIKTKSEEIYYIEGPFKNTKGRRYVATNIVSGFEDYLKDLKDLKAYIKRML